MWTVFRHYAVYVNSKDKCCIFCRFTCSLLSSRCFFSFACDWVDIAHCRMCCDCQSHVTHRGAGTSLAPHLLAQGTASGMRKTQWSSLRRDTKSDSYFLHFRLLQLCFEDFFFPNIFLFSLNIYQLWISEHTFLSCRAHICEMQGQVQSCSSCGWTIR